MAYPPPSGYGYPPAQHEGYPPAHHGHPPPASDHYGGGYGGGGGYPPRHDMHDAYGHPAPQQQPPPHGTHGQPSPAGYPPSGPLGHDHYGAGHHDSYYRQPPPGYPPDSGYPPPSGSYPPSSGYPPPGSDYPPTQHGGYPPPSGSGGPPGYPPPSGYAPPGQGPSGDPHAASYGGHYGSYAPPAYGQPPPGYGYGPPPPGCGYGPPPPGYPPHPGGRGPSPRRERSRRRPDNKRGKEGDRQGKVGERKQGKDGGKAGRKEGGDRESLRGPPTGNPSDPKSRIQHWLHNRSEWSALWFEGIDPPRRTATTPNVTFLVMDNAKLKTGDGSQDYGFILAHSRLGAKKRDREKDCCTDLVTEVDAFPMDDPKAWCQMPDVGAKQQVEPADMERLKEAVESRCPKTEVELPEPMVCVLVGVLDLNQNERSNGPDPDLGILDRFDAGFAELFQEARRVSGIVRKQWFLATVNVRKEGASKPFSLGVGLATDREIARARAVHSAEVRTQILTEAMLVKAMGEQDAPPSPDAQPAAEAPAP